MGQFMTESQITAGRFAPYLHRKDMELALVNLDGFGKKTVERLRDRGIMDQLDLVLFMPRKYQRIAHFMPGDQLFERQPSHVELYGEVCGIRKPQPGTRQPTEVTIEVDGRFVRLVWFNMERSNFTRTLSEGTWVHVMGDITYERSVPVMMHPTMNVQRQRPSPQPHRESVRPVYPSIEGIADKILRTAQLSALKRILPELGDIVPVALLERRDLPGVAQALSVIHVLREYEDIKRFIRELTRAKNRLVYEEFFTLQHRLANEYKAQRARAAAPMCAKRDLARQIVTELPFKLTGDQGRACGKIAQELERKIPMRRLLQGDVGSGKTIVALLSAAIAVESGQQVAIMAPTDILARQHLRRAEQFFGQAPIRMAYLGGSLGAAQRREVLSALERHELDLVFGTHALFQEEIKFGSLGLVVVDEQHKFGVEQRQLLLDKGADPHLLAMTATPIPRSLAHAVFGDLDLTIIREKPPGRQPIKTALRNRAVAPKVYDYVRERVLEHGEQAYFVYPMVEASEAVPGRENVTDAARELSEGPFAGLSVGVLHGRMSNEDKDDMMSRFAAGEIQILCATTVIEVGVDVANATMMIIESPEVFGLSQLHQLRGRVGRGSKTSLCVLLAGFDLSTEAQRRLESFACTEDGFLLAEADLEQRGPGQFLGVRQAGMAEFRFGDLFKDAELLKQAREDARELVLGALDEDNEGDEPGEARVSEGASASA